MFTPASSAATGSSRMVTSRAQPPLRRRLRAAAKENLGLRIVPQSVSGGASRSGFSRSRGHVARSYDGRTRFLPDRLRQAIATTGR